MSDGDSGGHVLHSGTVVQSRNGRPDSPPVVSSRAYLRDGLPAVYRDENFTMRFVGALEPVLDPIVAILDALPSYFDPALAPEHVLDLLATWLGVELDERQSPAERRAVVRQAAELGRRRGTAAGLALALRLSFPDLPLRIEDAGGVSWSRDPSTELEARPAQFVVYCDEPIPPELQAAVARCIEAAKPVHTSYRLRVRVRPSGSGPETQA